MVLCLGEGTGGQKQSKRQGKQAFWGSALGKKGTVLVPMCQKGFGHVLL